MVLQEAVLEPTQNQFLTFEDAVIISRQIEDFFNSPESDEMILALSQAFNLGIKENFVVHVEQIEKNCEECMGCHNGSCILGCFSNDDPNKVCFWDEAIEAVIGTKLIVHEYGHVIFDQIFTTKLSEEDAFAQSEAFAQFMEDNFIISLAFCANCSEHPIGEAPTILEGENEIHEMMHAGEMIDSLIGAVIGGVGFAIGGALIALMANQLLSPEDVPPDVIVE